IKTGGIVNAAKQISSVRGSTTIQGATLNLHQAIPIGTETQVDYPGIAAPPGASNASLAFASSGGVTSAPGGTNAATQRPSAPSGNGPGQASGSSDPGTADTGAA